MSNDMPKRIWAIGSFVRKTDREKLLEDENAELKEQLRWRTWPDEKPEIDQEIVSGGECWTYLGEGQIQSTDGDLCEFNQTDTWLQIPKDAAE